MLNALEQRGGNISVLFLILQNEFRQNGYS